MTATNWCPVPTVQWRLNGSPLANATNSSLVLTNFSNTQTGLYSVVISNFVRVTTNTVAYPDHDGDQLVSRAHRAMAVEWEPARECHQFQPGPDQFQQHPNRTLFRGHQQFRAGHD